MIRWPMESPLPIARARRLMSSTGRSRSGQQELANKSCSTREEIMTMDRRTFATLLASSVAAPALSSSLWAQAGNKMALYSGVGTTFTQYDIDVEGAALTKRGAVKLPDGTQYAWPHPNRKFLYVTSSSGGPSSAPGTSGNSHHVTAFRIDPSGALTQHGEPVALTYRPIHNSV